jgi:hypothetical protein
MSAVENQGEDRGADDCEEHRDREPGNASARAECEKETTLQIVWMLVTIGELVIAQIALRAVK